MATPIEVARVRAAAKDGRMANVRFQQAQLAALHDSLGAHRADILAAVVADNPRVNPTEAEVEFASALLDVRHAYTSLDLSTALATEYRIARGESSPARRVGFGVVALRPTEHSRLFSIFSVVACALAAGNTVVVQDDTTKAVDRLLPTILRVLDSEIYALVDDLDSHRKVLSTALMVDQTGQLADGPCIRARTDLPCAALVDRTADADYAARQICAARAAYGGGSPHHPRIVVVNEWVKQPFVEALLRHSSSGRDVSRKEIAGKGKQVDMWMEEAERKGEINTIHGEGLTVLDIKAGTHTSQRLMQEGGGSPHLLLFTVTGLVDAVLTLDHRELLVAYLFSTPDVAKYWSQQINSHATFANHIPQSMLLGPALATDQSIIPVDRRYTTWMLSRPRPEMITTIQAGESELRKGHLLAALSKNVNQPLPKTGQGPGTSMGFFEQGIVVGFVFIVIPVVSVTGFSVWTLLTKGIF
ncbi:hypothetical protein BO86DRAFT_397117 [Aspergillus japonicus CBS 114.51]|uniref:Aldehyde dehydrogenase domain-containing protein n=1 Tax=Aspergillus japonicus CBS 114.51 TaxID=1448312 RepID=A0A8T8X869_ASPJA|nr:hypothetical protein BO86DRAFT_397117 [Aspergillus japonicus CBS 114.51]RAH84251.1 hypothetical protein BO86DRAFT_397117 [Aspergillus japonicus CBS 114.51]